MMTLTRVDFTLNAKGSRPIRRNILLVNAGKVSEYCSARAVNPCSVNSSCPLIGQNFFDFNKCVDLSVGSGLLLPLEIARVSFFSFY
jgi:hypothetical protein